MLYSPPSQSVCLIWHPVASTITSVTSPFAEILLCSNHAELHSVPQSAVHFYTLTLFVPQVLPVTHIYLLFPWIIDSSLKDELSPQSFLPSSISHFPLGVSPLSYALCFLLSSFCILSVHPPLVSPSRLYALYILGS